MAILVDERADDGVLIGIQHVAQVFSAFRPADAHIDVVEEALYLVIEFVAIRDDDHAPIWDKGCLHDPLGEPCHDEGLARALGVPDDAAFAIEDALARGDVREVLVVACNLLLASIEDYEIVDEGQEAIFLAEGDNAVTEPVRLLGLHGCDCS